MTFSIVARDPSALEWGVAVQSKFVAIGALTPWAKAGVGAIATQAWINTSYGSQGLTLLERGFAPREALAHLTKADQRRAHRQVGIIGVSGEPMVYTGEACPEWAGSFIGEQYACQGNCLVSEQILQAMAQAFEEREGPLYDRLMAALFAGQAAGVTNGGSNQQHSSSSAHTEAFEPSMIASSISELMTIRLPLRSCSASYGSAWLIHRGKLAKKSRAKRRMVLMKTQAEKKIRANLRGHFYCKCCSREVICAQRMSKP